MQRSDNSAHNDTGPVPAKKAGAVGVAGWLAIAVLVCFLGVSIWFALETWNSMEGVVISTHGKIAMVLGIVITTVVGAGLMALVFWSSHKGFDR